MRIARTRQELDTLRAEHAGGTAFVPTMGALHEGHLSLMQHAGQLQPNLIVSIFVNPTQFAPHEDFASYPRDEQSDMEKLKDIGVDILFLPTTKTLYPNGMESKIKAGQAANGLETDFRPHFFDGVVNVVARLFEIIKPDTAIFGEKDFQQLQVIKEMIDTHEMNVDVIGAPIIRDKDGLALSSRNAYLSQSELYIARQFNKILKSNLSTEDMAQELLKAGFDKIDYIEKRWERILGAAWLGKTRLIDNVKARPSSS
ncbi:MAG: pantoate--beta-alanine ligase [Alphaproteobacteria bacterium]